MYYINDVFSQIDPRLESHVLSNQANDWDHHMFYSIVLRTISTVVTINRYTRITLSQEKTEEEKNNLVAY
jgi:hypothetical protein